jgi:hypothetical protein
VPQLDISDHAFVALPPVDVGRSGDGPCALSAWVPGLGLEPVLDRGEEGVLWRAVARDPAGVPWSGTAEVWLEPWHDGTVVHVYVRLDPAGDAPGHVRGPALDRWRESLRDRWRWLFLAWRRRVDAGRAPGAAARRTVPVNVQTAAS